ncbi:taste receptor type 2 member 10-like [Otolemur garnettii]|uniref:taste receptor type 2 member 10-like n=1 Tax=Otolemur garnettii TaxID=30611 RepID=UPI00027427E3|nr:taste receptor type 2 member 10-like [Otolemur garnettii]
MLSAVEGIFIAITIIESILGFLGNGLIALVYCNDCVRNKRTILGFILTGLAISRICLIWIIIIDGLMHVLSPDAYYSSSQIEYIGYMWVIINHSSVCFATSLNIFYFLKIANFSHYIFLWCKMRISRILPLLKGFLLISLVITLPQVTKVFHDDKMKKRNTTWQFNRNKNEYIYQQLLLNLGVIFFLTLSLITSFLLIISLWRHNRKMQLNATGFRDPSTEAHVKAMKVLISFIILFILYFVGYAIEILYFIVPRNNLLLILGMTTTAIYPWGHSFILILGNNKLKQASLQVLQQFKCCEKGGNLKEKWMF